MATPLTTLSKYTGPTMVVLCGLLMISFVVADPLVSYFQGGSGGGTSSRGGNLVAVWDTGQITERQLADAVRHRRVLAKFQERVYIRGTQDAQAAGVGDLPLRVRPLQLPISNEQGVERDVIQTKIFAEQASKAGMVVSDEMVVDYLRALGRDRVDNAQMREILMRLDLGAGRTATIQFVFDLIREAMLSRNYITSHQYAFETVLPEERYRDWLQVNDRVLLEAAPVRTDEFLAQTAEPTDGELAELFELYRDRTPVPDVLRGYGGIELPSPLPAFATPERVSIQYVKADFNTMAEKLSAQVSDADVAQYYEENLESFIKADESLFGNESLFEEDNAEESKPAEGATTDGASVNPLRNPSAGEESTEEGPIEEEATEEATEEEEEEEEQTDTNATDVADAAQTTLAPEENAKKAEYQSLDEVSDEIRRRLAENRAADAIRTTMVGLKSELDDEYADYFDTVLDADDAKIDPPAAPASLTDLGPLAEKHGLELGSVAQASLIDLREMPIGKTANADETANQVFPLWVLCYRKGELDQYEPAVTYDLDGNRYLAIITERLDKVTPELDEVRDVVVAAWKRDKGAELALAEAESLASKANASGQPLAALFPEDESRGTFETDPFSYLTIGNISPQTGEVSLQLSQPEPLLAAGPDLLKAVFDLEPGQAGSVLNHDRSIAYVIRIAARLESEEQLRSRFLREGDSWYGLPTMMRSRIRRAANGLLSNLLDNSGIQWSRDPDVMVEE